MEIAKYIRPAQLEKRVNPIIIIVGRVQEVRIKIRFVLLFKEANRRKMKELELKI